MWKKDAKKDYSFKGHVRKFKGELRQCDIYLEKKGHLSLVNISSSRWLSNESEGQHPEYTLMAHPTINSSCSLF